MPFKDVHNTAIGIGPDQPFLGALALQKLMRIARAGCLTWPKTKFALIQTLKLTEIVQAVSCGKSDE